MFRSRILFNQPQIWLDKQFQSLKKQNDSASSLLLNKTPTQKLQSLNDIQELMKRLRLKEIELLHLSHPNYKHFLIGTAFSSHHLFRSYSALQKQINGKLIKRTEPGLEDWMIVQVPRNQLLIHLFTEEGRSQYDLKDIWSLYLDSFVQMTDSD